jgi:hypothetical protein
MMTGRRLRKRLTHASPADPAARPPAREDFTAPPELLPGILMAWDFCSSYRCRPLNILLTTSRFQPFSQRFMCSRPN